MPGQDITCHKTGGSRLLSEKCATCILAPGDRMRLGADGLREFIDDALGQDAYVVCHQTLTYGEHPGFGPAICRGFFDAYSDLVTVLGFMKAANVLVEVDPPGAQP